MSRSGYSEDYDEEFNNASFLWMQGVKNAIKGKRGQQFLRELLVALDAMPEKKLIRGDLEVDGSVCALGSVGKARGLNMQDIDTTDHRALGKMFGIARSMAQEIMFQNDDDFRYMCDETPEQRWARVRQWAVDQLVKP